MHEKYYIFLSHRLYTQEVQTSNYSDTNHTSHFSNACSLYFLYCGSFTELADHLHTWLSTHECGNLSLLMNPDIFLLENVDTLPEVPDDIYLNSGYPDRLAVVYPRNTMDSLELDRSKGSLLPHTVVSAKQNVYFFSPVHFREREIGYLVLENCDYLLDHQFLFETLNTFRTSIEALYGKLILRKKNKQLSQLYIHDSLTILSEKNRMAFPIEASIGFVVADDPIFSLNDYINLADEKMYAAKKAAKRGR